VIDIPTTNNNEEKPSNPRWDTVEHEHEWWKYRQAVDWAVEGHEDQLQDGADNRVLVNSPDHLKKSAIVAGHKMMSRDYAADMMFDLQIGNWRGEFRVEDAAGVGHHRQAADLAFQVLGMEYNSETNRYEEPKPPELPENPDLMQSIDGFSEEEFDQWYDDVREWLGKVDNLIGEAFGELQNLRSASDKLPAADAERLLHQVDVMNNQLQRVRGDVKQKQSDLDKYVDEQREIKRDNSETENEDYYAARRNIEHAEGCIDSSFSLVRLVVDRENSLGQLYGEVKRSSES
jgi:hypothetical protein